MLYKYEISMNVVADSGRGSLVCLSKQLISVSGPLHKQLAKWYPVPQLFLLFAIPKLI